MAIKSDKVRTSLTITKEMKSNLEEVAKDNNRSFNNMIITILSDYLKSQEKK